MASTFWRQVCSVAWIPVRLCAGDQTHTVMGLTRVGLLRSTLVGLTTVMVLFAGPLLHLLLLRLARRRSSTGVNLRPRWSTFPARDYLVVRREPSAPFDTDNAPSRRGRRWTREGNRASPRPRWRKSSRSVLVWCLFLRRRAAPAHPSFWAAPSSSARPTHPACPDVVLV